MSEDQKTTVLIDAEAIADADSISAYFLEVHGVKMNRSATVRWALKDALKHLTRPSSRTDETESESHHD